MQMLADRVARHGTRPVYIFLEDGLGPGVSWTFDELDQHVRTIAVSLCREVPLGSRILIMAPPGLDYIASFLGCLYAGMVAVPAYPPSPFALERELGRLRSVVADANAEVAITTRAWLSLAESAELRCADRPVRWVCADDEAVGSSEASDFRPVMGAADDLAFLQYTSGSTSDPKGVMITHGNLAANLDLIRECYGLTEHEVAVTWLPPYHDMGLIGLVLGPIAHGGLVVVISPEVFLRHPLRWLQAMSDFHGTITAAPNFAFDLCVRRTTAEDRTLLDLSSWRVAINGAEPILPDVIDRFTAAFGPFGFRSEAMYPSYGLAETTLLVAAGSMGASATWAQFDGDALAQGHARSPSQGMTTRTLLGCGRPPSGTAVTIVDTRSGRPVAAGAIGEIVVDGPSVAAGYWHRPDETAEVFSALADARRSVRTGDLGCLVDGQLFVTGRIKDLVIIRGRNHYPQDIEQTVLETDDRLRPGCGTAFAVDSPDGEMLILAQEVRAVTLEDGEALTTAIRRAVTARHQVAPDVVMILAPRTIPKTSSGKIRRRATRDAFRTGELTIIHAWHSPRYLASVG